MHCLRYKAKPRFPLMGDLPVERLGIHIPAFSYGIIDLAGSTASRYIFIYSCLTTRAIHLELIEGLATNSTIIVPKFTRSSKNYSYWQRYKFCWYKKLVRENSKWMEWDTTQDVAKWVSTDWNMNDE